MIKNFSKKIVGLALLAILTGYLLPITVLALDYVPLVTLPGASEAGKPLTDPGEYIKGAFNLAIGIAAVLAIIMIVIGGIQYMGTESIGGKGAGLKKIKDAVLGLLLALGSYVLLFTINPSLVNFSVSIAGIEPPPAGITPITQPPPVSDEQRIKDLAVRHNAALEQKRADALGDADKLDSVALEYEEEARALGASADCRDTSSPPTQANQDCLALASYYATEAGKIKVDAAFTRIEGVARTDYQTILNSFATLSADPTREQIEEKVSSIKELKNTLDGNYEENLAQLLALPVSENTLSTVDKVFTNWATRDTAIARNMAETYLLGNLYTYTRTERGPEITKIMDIIVADTKAKLNSEELNKDGEYHQLAKNEIQRAANLALSSIQASCRDKEVVICANYQPTW